MSLIDIIKKTVKKKKPLTYQILSGRINRMKAIPANGKRWKKSERPEIADITFRGSYDDAMELLSSKPKHIAVILWIPVEEIE